METEFGEKFAFIIIGATCVGSINLCKNENECQSTPEYLNRITFNKGEDIGFFAVNLFFLLSFSC